MKKILFIDRDGTIIIEPPDEQIDSLEKLEFYPGAIFNLARIARELDYEFVMVSNQDGLGTKSFPEETFWPPHNKMLRTLENENICFSRILIDKSFPHENADTRKPQTGMLSEFMDPEYCDLNNSYVIGDRETDVELAMNLGTNAILLSDKENKDARLNTQSWDDIYQFLRFPKRTSDIARKTNETDVKIKLNLDGNGKATISTGVDFFDHMLEQVAKHTGIDINISVQGDINVDKHHTIEDTAIVLGQAFSDALGNKKGINRYGFLLPMDDSLAQVAIDFSGRNWLEWDVIFKREKIGDFPCEMFFHFFKSFTDTAKCNLNIKAEGKNEHHKIEAIFKAFAQSIKQAIKRDRESNDLPSTKGIL